MSEEATKKTEKSAKFPTREEFDRRYLLLIVVPLGVYLLFYFILGKTRNDGIAFEFIPFEQFAIVAHAEAKYRYFWISAFLVSSAVSLAVIVSSAMSLYREMLPRHRRLVISLVVLLVTAIVIYESSPQIFDRERWYQYMGADLYDTMFDRKRWYEYMGAGLYEATLGNMPVAIGLIDIPAPRPESILHLFDIGLNLVKFFAATALIIIGVGSILTLSSITAEKVGDPKNFTEHKAKHLARNIALLKGYLYQGSAVFVFAIIAMISWMFWPIPFLNGDNVQIAYRELVVGSAILQGVGYTLAIAALYLPPVLLLRQRISRMAKQELVGDETISAEEWLRQRGLDFKPLEELRQVVAVLLPTVISVVPALTNI